jgi:hypothetical protein
VKPLEASRKDAPLWSYILFILTLSKGMLYFMSKLSMYLLLFYCAHGFIKANGFELMVFELAHGFVM